MLLKHIVRGSLVGIALYVISIFLNWTWLALLLVSLSPLLVIWLVYRVLKDPYASTHTFEDRFYEDNEYRRNN